MISPASVIHIHENSVLQYSSLFTIIHEYSRQCDSRLGCPSSRSLAPSVCLFSVLPKGLLRHASAPPSPAPLFMNSLRRIPHRELPNRLHVLEGVARILRIRRWSRLPPSALAAIHRIVLVLDGLERWLERLLIHRDHHEVRKELPTPGPCSSGQRGCPPARTPTQRSPRERGGRRFA